MKIVIVGAGEVGYHIASRLAFENKDVVVIDSNPETLVRLSESIDVQMIIGSGSSPVVLEEAGIGAQHDVVARLVDLGDLAARARHGSRSPSSRTMAANRPRAPGPPTSSLR